MKIVLFIGHHKVGSSALQDYLARHAIALLRQGVLYPAVEGQGLATLLARAMTGEAREEHLPVNLREGHNALAFRMLHDQDASPVPALHQGLPPTEQMLCMIRRQIEVFEPQVMILAAEVFSNFAAVSESLITRLVTAFPGAEVTLVASLRRVDDYMISWHGQRLRFGQKVRALPNGALDYYARTIHFDYRLMLEAWIRALPGARLVLRPYDAVLAAGGSVADFIAQAGLAGPARLAGLAPGDASRARMNRGLHRGVIEIARQCNAALGAEDASDTFDVLLKLGFALDLPQSAQVELYGAEARSRMAARFAPIHDWLSTQVGGVFFADADKIGRLCPHPEHEVARAALAQVRQNHRAAFVPAARAFLDGLELTPNHT